MPNRPAQPIMLCSDQARMPMPIDVVASAEASRADEKKDLQEIGCGSYGASAFVRMAMIASSSIPYSTSSLLSARLWMSRATMSRIGSSVTAR